MRKISKAILGVAAGGLAVASYGYSSKVQAAANNYQDTTAVNTIYNTASLPTGKPTPTYASKPTPTYASKPTPTYIYGSKPTPTYASKPTPKVSPKPSPKVSPKLSPKPSPKASALSNSVEGILQSVTNWFSGFFK